MSGLNLGIIKETKLKRPPIELQNQFAEIYGRVGELKSRHQQSLIYLEALYGALSQRAFKGELDLSRVPLPDNAPQEPQPAVPIDLTPPATKALSIDLPDTDLLSVALENRERVKDLLQFWLAAYRAQLSGAPFSAQAFIVAAETRLAELHPDKHFEVGAEDYEHIKSWVFATLADGRLTQGYAEAHNRVELTSAPAQG